MYKKLGKEIKRENFCYHKTGRAITTINIGSNREKSNIFIAILGKRNNLIKSFRILCATILFLSIVLFLLLPVTIYPMV